MHGRSTLVITRRWTLRCRFSSFCIILVSAYYHYLRSVDNVLVSHMSTIIVRLYNSSRLCFRSLLISLCSLLRRLADLFVTSFVCNFIFRFSLPRALRDLTRFCSSFNISFPLCGRLLYLIFIRTSITFLVHIV